MKKNRDKFKPDSFKIFMQAPCGRLLTKAVLTDLGVKEKYKELVIYKEPLSSVMKNNCIRHRTKIYINENQNIKEILL